MAVHVDACPCVCTTLFSLVFCRADQMQKERNSKIDSSDYIRMVQVLGFLHYFRGQVFEVAIRLICQSNLYKFPLKFRTFAIKCSNSRFFLYH